MTTGQLFMLCFVACVALLFAVWGVHEWAWHRGRRRYDRGVAAARDGYLQAIRERDEQLRADLERRFAEEWRQWADKPVQLYLDGQRIASVVRRARP